MLRKSRYIKPQASLETRRGFSFSPLVIEAAIATLVLSVFVASSPRLFPIRSSTSHARTVEPLMTVQPHLLDEGIQV
jgi:hypothetical protein